MATIIERARRYVWKCDPAVSGQGGHDQTFHVACVLVHGFDLSDTEALRVFLEWNASCSPPWSEAELVHKIKSARGASHKYPLGYLLGSQVPKGAADRKKSGAEAQAFARPAKPQFCPMVLK